MKEHLEEQRSAFVTELNNVVEGWQGIMHSVLDKQITVLQSPVKRDVNYSSTTVGLQTSVDRGLMTSSTEARSSSRDTAAADSVSLVNMENIRKQEEQLSREQASMKIREANVTARERELKENIIQLEAQKRVFLAEQSNSSEKEFHEKLEIFTKLGAKLLQLFRNLSRKSHCHNLTQPLPRTFNNLTQTLVFTGAKLADEIPRKRAQKLAASVIYSKFKLAFSLRKAMAFSNWRKFTSGAKEVEQLFRVDRMEAQLLESHRREDEIMRRAAEERRKSSEEQLRLHGLCRDAEVEKQQALLQAEASVSASLRRQIELSANSYNSMSVPGRISAATTTTRSIENLYSNPSDPDPSHRVPMMNLQGNTTLGGIDSPVRGQSVGHN